MIDLILIVYITVFSCLVVLCNFSLFYRQYLIVSIQRKNISSKLSASVHYEEMFIVKLSIMNTGRYQCGYDSCP